LALRSSSAALATALAVLLDLLLAGLLVPRPAAASALDLFGFGARGPAMGDTGVAFADGFEAVYLNPANLALATRRRLTLGTQGGRFDLNADGASRPVDSLLGLTVGATLPIPLGGVMANRLALGLGFYLPAGIVNRGRVPPPGSVWMPLLESRTEVVGVQLAAAVRPLPFLTLGAGVLALAALEGRIVITADAAGRFGTRAEEELVTDYALICGATLLLPKGLRLGVAYRGESSSGFDMAIEPQLGSSLPLGVPVMIVAGISQFDPAQLATEVALTLPHQVLLSANLTFKRWSSYGAPTANVTEGSPPQPPPGFRDTFVPRLGIEVGFPLLAQLHGVARGGYFFEPTPIPEQRAETNMLDNHRHVLSLGVGLDIGRPAFLHIDAFYQHHFLVPRTHTKDALPMATGGGASALSRWRMAAPRHRLRMADDLASDQATPSRLSSQGAIDLAGLTIGVDL
jgi:long-chain fatty acid transport protein